MKTVIFEGYSVTVERATIRDVLHAEIISGLVSNGAGKGELGLWGLFGDLCSQVRECTGLPFDPRTLHELSKEQAYAAYQKWLGLPKALHLLWRGAIEDVDSPVLEGSGSVDPNVLAVGSSIPPSQRKTPRTRRKP
jgi:hypothetical protein